MNSDSTFITGLKSQDSKAYTDFVKSYSSKVYNTSLGILQNKEDAEEVAQDVFIKIFQSIQQFDGKSSLSTWVYRITVNKSLDALRSKKRKSPWSVFVNFFGDNGELQHNAVDFVHPGVIMEQREHAAQLFKAIEKLPERQKAVFVLHKVEELSYQEIADTLELSLSAVDSLMSRARTNLKQYLTPIKDT